MLRSVRRLSVVVTAVAMAGCATPPPDTTAADTEAINNVRSAWVAAINAEDSAKLATLYTADAVRMEDNMPAVVGRDAIQAGFKELTTAFDCDVSVTPEETMVAGDWAFDRGQFMSHMMPKDPKVPMIMDQGKYIVILAKQADGSWLIAREIGNSNVPLPPPPTAAK